MRANRYPRLSICLAFTLALSACGGTINSRSNGSDAASTSGVTSVTTSADPLSFADANYSVNQSVGLVTLSVQRSGPATGEVQVSYSSADGTALAGTDYTATSGALEWAANDSQPKTISVPISTSIPFVGNKQFTVTLNDPTDGATIASPSSATVTISGAASAPVGSLLLSESIYQVIQSAGAVTVTVNRTGGTAGAVSVAYATANGTAVAGTEFTAVSGTLEWADGDATSKSFSVNISNVTPFSGSKSFSVTLSDPSGGSTLNNPSSATVSITGSGGSGSGGPSAVSNLQLVNQGGPSDAVNTGEFANTSYQQISWDAATPGANPIAGYNIYRNGVLYATTKALSYTDTAATNSNVPTWVKPATVYRYTVVAVDTQGNVGPRASQMSVYGYRNGHSNWSNADLSYGGAVPNYASTAGNPQGGPYDIAVYFPGSGGFLPTSDAPQSPSWDLEIGAYNYFVIDVNPGPTTNYQAPVTLRTRLPPGDIYGWAPWPNIFNYGPKPVANTWATYKIPLSVFNMGIGQFTGSISGTTLTVTAVSSGVVDAGGFVTGPGVPAGTYITAYSQSASIGTFTVAGPGINSSTSVPSTQMTYQRTSLYKLGIQPNIGTGTMYYNNMGFTVN